MFIDPPSWFERGEVLRWVAGLFFALALHLLALFLVVRVGQAPVMQTAPAAVMMQFSAQAQSIQIQKVLPVGPPQVVTPMSMRSQPDPQPETSSDTQVNVDDSPLASKPEIVVKRQRSRQRKTADRKVAKVTKKADAKSPSRWPM